MRKLILTIAGIVAVVVIMAAYKYKTGTETYWPLPYHFTVSSYQNADLDAPILIIGDRMGHRLGQFKDILAQEVSKGLSVPIKVASIATEQEGLHRTLEKIKKIKKLPLIIIYIGGSEEFLEKKYDSKEIDAILSNLNMFNNLEIKTLLMMQPWTSRLIYRNVKETVFDEKLIIDETKYRDDLILKRNEIDYYFYQYELEKLITNIKDHNAYFIALTTPINLDSTPRVSCELTIDDPTQKQLNKVLKLIESEDFKGAYRLSKELPQLAPSNAQAHFIHGKVCKQLGYTKEAIQSLELAASFDCKRWRATPVHNAIIKKVTKANDVVLYDFNQMLYDNWTKNITFQDDIYPQNFFMEKMVSTLATQIRKLLKL